jgi:hypothetical protein
MRLNDIADLTVNHLFGRLLRRGLAAALLALFAAIAFYYASAAGTLALSIKFGLLYAYVIMAAIYAVAAMIVLIALWATRRKPLVSAKVEGALANPRNMQIAMLIEAVMLGYSMARKSGDRIR